MLLMKCTKCSKYYNLIPFLDKLKSGDIESIMKNTNSIKFSVSCNNCEGTNEIRWKPKTIQSIIRKYLSDKPVLNKCST